MSADKVISFKAPEAIKSACNLVAGGPLGVAPASVADHLRDHAATSCTLPLQPWRWRGPNTHCLGNGHRTVSLSQSGRARPGLRRGTSRDDFKDHERTVEIAAFLDDPTLPSVETSD